MSTDEIGAITGSLDNFVRTAFAVCELGYGTAGGVAVDLDTGHDKVTDFKSNRRPRFVGTLTVDGAAFLGKEAENLFGKLCSRAGKTEESMDVARLM